MGAYFTISSIIYTGIFMYYFFSKNTLKNIETKIYKILLITTFVGLCLDALSFLAYEKGVSPDSFLYQSLAKGVLVYFLVWIGSFTYYIYAISYQDMEDENGYRLKLRKFGNVLRIAITLMMVLAFVLPISFNIKNDVIFPIGRGVDLTYLTVAVCLLMCFYVAFKNIKHIVIKKYTPLFAMVVLVVVSALIQKIFPELFLVNFSISLIVLILYFSVENPDIKIINELRYSKEMLKRANNATNKGLVLLTKELAEPLELLHEFGSKEFDLNNERKTLKNVKELQEISLELVDQINGILELTRIENEDSELNKCNYNSKELFGDIKHLLIAQNSRFNKKKHLLVDEDIRKVLNGDPLKIKKTVAYIYRYLFEISGNKEIVLKIDDTNTKAMTRLRFSFIFEKGDIAYQNLFLEHNIDTEIINRLIELQNAKLEVKLDSDKVIVEFLINQIFVPEYEIEEVMIKNNSLKDYCDCQGKRVLIIDDNIGKINNLIDLLKPYNVTIEVAHDYPEYENKIYDHTDWHLILLDDMMPDTDKFEFFHLNELERNNSLLNIQKLTNERLPLVIMITPNKSDLGDIHYDYLLKPVNAKDLDKVIKKYLVK